MAFNKQLPRSTPEQQGIPAGAIHRFLDEVERAAVSKSQELHSFMLLRHGYVVAESWWKPYRPELPHMLFSLSKSFTSTAIGLAVSEGLISVSDKVVSFFPEYLPGNVSDNLAAMSIHHLLSMSAGHSECTMGACESDPEGNWVRGFLAAPVPHEPGTHFVYNTGATYMLSAILQKVTGQTLMEYLTPRIFNPLGIEDAFWISCPMGINTGGFGLSVKTEDIAKLGQLYLQKGLWNGQRLLSESWVATATSKQVSNGDDPNNDWTQGYGYQFWRCRHNIYRGDGAFGQYCIVMPEQDAVIAITSGVADMQAVLNLVWEHLLPAMGEKTADEDTIALDGLRSRMSGLQLGPKSGSAMSGISSEVSGCCYELESGANPIKGISIAFRGDCFAAVFKVEDGECTVKGGLGLGHWIESGLDIPGFPPKASINGVWVNGNTFEITLRYIDSPFADTILCRYSDDTVRVSAATNVSFGPRERFEITGRRV